MVLSIIFNTYEEPKGQYFKPNWVMRLMMLVEDCAPFLYGAAWPSRSRTLLPGYRVLPSEMVLPNQVYNPHLSA